MTHIGMLFTQSIATNFVTKCSFDAFVYVPFMSPFLGVEQVGLLFLKQDNNRRERHTESTRCWMTALAIDYSLVKERYCSCRIFGGMYLLRKVKRKIDFSFGRSNGSPVHVNLREIQLLN